MQNRHKLFVAFPINCGVPFLNCGTWDLRVIVFDQQKVEEVMYSCQDRPSRSTRALWRHSPSPCHPAKEPGVASLRRKDHEDREVQSPRPSQMTPAPVYLPAECRHIGEPRRHQQNNFQPIHKIVRNNVLWLF